MLEWQRNTIFITFQAKKEIFQFLIEEGVKLLKNSVEIKTEKLENSIDKIKAVVLIEIKVLVKYEDFMTIVLSEIWGNGPRSILCKKYVFEYIQMIEKIVENGINKKEIIDGDKNVYSLWYIRVYLFEFDLQNENR